MNNKPIYAIAVFNDKIKGSVLFTEDLAHNRVKIDLNIIGLNPWRIKWDILILQGSDTSNELK